MIDEKLKEADTKIYIFIPSRFWLIVEEERVVRQENGHLVFQCFVISFSDLESFFITRLAYNIYNSSSLITLQFYHQLKSNKQLNSYIDFDIWYT